MTTSTRCALYARVSDSQDGKSESVAQQLAAMTAEVERRGWSVVATYTDDGVSASRYAHKQREGWPSLLRLVRSGGCDVVAVWETSRLSRDLSSFAQFRDLCEARNVKWLISGGLIDPAADHDRLAMGVHGLLNEQASRETSKRVRRAMQARAEAGELHGMTPYGYRRIYAADRSVLRVEVIEVEAEVLRQAATDILAGASLRSIVLQLNREGIPMARQALAARAGRPVATQAGWTTRGLKRLLTSPTYAGLRVHQGKVIGVGTWPVLWDETQHRRLVAALSGRGVVRSTTIAHYLSGVLECEHCHKMLRVINRQHGGLCYACTQAGCFKVAVNLAEVEQVIGGLVLRAVRDERFKKHTGGRIESIRAQMAELRTRLTDAESEFVAGRLSAATLARVEAPLTAQIAVLEADLARLDVPAPLPSPEALAASWDDLGADRRRYITRLTLGRVIVLSAGRKRVPAMARLRFPDVWEV